MRSIIIIEVEHDETTDELEALANNIVVDITEDDSLDNVTVLDYTVRVDLPECFRLEK